MTNRLAIVALAGVAACGDDRAPPDGAIADLACAATFHGNFEEASRSADSCPSLRRAPGATGRWSLEVDVPAAALGASFAIAIDLGPSPTTGTSSSQTVRPWSAFAAQRIGEGACLYRAGSDAVPSGSFRLELDALDVATGAAHGTLEVTTYVLTVPGTDCGDGDIETLALDF